MKLAILFFIISSALHADIVVPSSDCEKPKKPEKFIEQSQADEYNLDVLRYRNCIENFVNKEKKIIEIHIKARDKALNEWNEFAKENS